MFQCHSFENTCSCVDILSTHVLVSIFGVRICFYVDILSTNILLCRYFVYTCVLVSIFWVQMFLCRYFVYTYVLVSILWVLMFLCRYLSTHMSLRQYFEYTYVLVSIFGVRICSSVDISVMRLSKKWGWNCIREKVSVILLKIFIHPGICTSTCRSVLIKSSSAPFLVNFCV